MCQGIPVQRPRKFMPKQTQKMVNTFTAEYSRKQN